MSEPIDLKRAEPRAIAFHERSVADAADIWRDGLNLLLRGFDPIRGLKSEREETTVLIALMMQAWQTLQCSFDLAQRGYSGLPES